MMSSSSKCIKVIDCALHLLGDKLSENRMAFVYVAIPCRIVGWKVMENFLLHILHLITIDLVYKMSNSYFMLSTNPCSM